MVAACSGVVVAASGEALLWAAAKFADANNHGSVEQAALVEISEEAAEALVEHWGGLRLHAFLEALMDIPGMIVTVGDLGPDNLNDARAGFHQPAGEQAALAKGVPAIEFAGLVIFLADIKGIAGAAADDEVQGLIVIFVQVKLGDGFVQFGRSLVNGVAQACAATQALAENLGAHLKVIDLDLVHLAHVHVATGRVQVIRIVGLAEEAGSATLSDDIAFLQRARQHDEREHGLFLRLEAGDVGAEVREILGAWRLQLAGWADFVGRVAGHHLVNGGGVIEQPVGRVAHGADHGEFIIHLCQIWQQLGEMHAGQLGLDGLKHAAHLVGGIGLGIPKIEVRRAALQIAENDALGLAPAGAAGVLGFLRARLQFEHPAERQAQQAGTTHTQQVAS